MTGSRREFPCRRVTIQSSNPVRQPTAYEIGDPEFTKSDLPIEKTLSNLTISVPRSLLDVLRPISLQPDLEYSKVLIVGSDAFVRDNRHKVSPELYEEYKRLRNPL
jgi:hypothetical protein